MARRPNRNQPQAQPGAAFRIPGMGARPRRVLEEGPVAQGTAYNLNQGQATPIQLAKFEQLDIVKSYLLELDYSIAPHLNAGAAFVQSQLAPTNHVEELQVQFESAYSTFRLPGWLAHIMQNYRPSMAPKDPHAGLWTDGIPVYDTPNQAGYEATTWVNDQQTAAQPLRLPQGIVEGTDGHTYVFSEYLEIPVSMYFDLYYELSASGQPLGMPIPRAIVSPQRMAASTRNVIPKLTMNPLLLGADAYDAPITTAAAPTTQTVVGTADVTFWRDGWIPTDNLLTEPPGRMWQYTRDYIAFQPAQSRTPSIPLDDEIVGQGQILSLVFATWDPNLNAGVGGFTPYTSYDKVHLRLGSKIDLFQDTPKSNQWAWATLHGSILPNGVMGWDLALTEDGRLTNENAINTLVQNGAQLYIEYVAGSVPSAGSTVYVGMEVLKKVGS